jgi:diaminohydroxyphosphoribosylaminopyrimidine deaminase/5-amino-6-(5-phosphoribosylamino)uracil reductase
MAASAHAMRQAAAEARKWLGATSPNPPVGAAALDAEGRVLAIAAHHHAGEAHAEATLIETCRRQDLIGRIDTLCVTLEPCNHHGLTPPCTEAIIAAGIKKVAIGTRDPNPHVKGGGLERLQEAGITVTAGIAEEECRQLIHAFAYRAQTGKPWVTIKRALTSEGSMIPPAGEKTFTSPKSLRLAHLLRKKADAILTGSGTILADHPLFTVRHMQDHAGKRRWLAILDRRGRTPSSYIAAANERGLDAVIYTDIDQALHDLTAKGAQDVLVEAGPALSQSVLDRGLWTMSVTVRQAERDIIDIAFNPREPLPFDARHFRRDFILPNETQ